MVLLEFSQFLILAWFITGLIFIVLEWFIPKFIFIFFTLGAWLTSLMLIITPTTLDNQLFFFCFSSISMLILLHNLVKKKKIWGIKSTEEPSIRREFIGKMVMVIQDFDSDGFGKVEFKGAKWSATCKEKAKKGDKVKIVGYDSILLHVKKYSS